MKNLILFSLFFFFIAVNAQDSIDVKIKYNYNVIRNRSKESSQKLIRKTFNPREIEYLNDMSYVGYINFDNSFYERCFLADNNGLAILEKNKVIPTSYVLYFKIKNKFNEDLIIFTECDQNGFLKYSYKEFLEMNEVEHKAFNRKYKFTIQKSVDLLRSTYTNYSIDPAPMMIYFSNFRDSHGIFSDRLCYKFKLSKSDTVVEIFVDVKTGCFYKPLDFEK